MDRVIAQRLENDENFSAKINLLIKNYIDAGLKTVNYYIDEFDAAHDIFMCYRPLNRKDLEMLDRGHPKQFILPMTTTQIDTMTVFLAQVLYGGYSPWIVEARNQEDELKADMMNQLHRWNAEKQPTYMVGYLWIQDCLVYNRGIMYDHWEPLEKCEFEEVDAEDTTQEQVEVPDVDPETGEQAFDEVQQVDEATGVGIIDQEKNPIMQQVPRTKMAHPTYKRLVKKRTRYGGYNKIEIVSPYDFIADPLLPMYRASEMRYMGHKTVYPWLELKKRSGYDVEDDQYVSPKAVEKLKRRAKDNSIVPSDTGSRGGTQSSAAMSRTRYERTRNLIPGNSANADDKDGGMIEVHELWVKLIPSEYDIIPEGEPGADQIETYQVLTGDGKNILSLNAQPNLHDQFPYAVAEGRPSSHYQFAPGYVLLLKNLQDHIDYLKDKHQEAIARTVGNMFIVNPAAVNTDDFTNPDKMGLLIELRPEAQQSPISEVIQQVKTVDTTQGFHAEMKQFIDIAEVTSGANSQMQGETPEEGTTATASSQAAQMSAGRLTSLARLLSVQGLVNQTHRFTMNFQQFLEDKVVVALRGGDIEWRPEFKDKSSVLIDRDMLQGEFDVIPHDGSLPGTDAKAVAAMTRLFEVAQAYPQMFDNTKAGNLDGKAMIMWTAKKAGAPVDNFYVTPEQAAENLAQQQAAMQPGMPPQSGMPPQAPQLPQGAPQVTGEQIPVGGGLSMPNAGPSSIPSASPPQVRPQNV